jgi:hypothetical protein
MAISAAAGMAERIYLPGCAGLGLRGGQKI